MVSESHSYGSDLLNQPFELTALEVALKEICQSYAAAEKQLEALISPACDALLKKVHEPIPECTSTPTAWVTNAE